MYTSALALSKRTDGFGIWEGTLITLSSKYLFGHITFINSRSPALPFRKTVNQVKKTQFSQETNDLHILTPRVSEHTVWGRQPGGVKYSTDWVIPTARVWGEALGSGAAAHPPQILGGNLGDREQMTSHAAFPPTVVKVWTAVRPRAISAYSLSGRRDRRKTSRRVRDPMRDHFKQVWCYGAQAWSKTQMKR